MSQNFKTHTSRWHFAPTTFFKLECYTSDNIILNTSCFVFDLWIQVWTVFPSLSAGAASAGNNQQPATSLVWQGLNSQRDSVMHVYTVFPSTIHLFRALFCICNKIRIELSGDRLKRYENRMFNVNKGDCLPETCFS